MAAWLNVVRCNVEVLDRIRILVPATLAQQLAPCTTIFVITRVRVEQVAAATLLS